MRLLQRRLLLHRVALNNALHPRCQHPVDTPTSQVVGSFHATMAAASTRASQQVGQLQCTQRDLRSAHAALQQLQQLLSGATAADAALADAADAPHEEVAAMALEVAVLRERLLQQEGQLQDVQARERVLLAGRGDFVPKDLLLAARNALVEGEMRQRQLKRQMEQQAARSAAARQALVERMASAGQQLQQVAVLAAWRAAAQGSNVNALLGADNALRAGCRGLAADNVQSVPVGTFRAGCHELAQLCDLWTMHPEPTQLPFSHAPSMQMEQLSTALEAAGDAAGSSDASHTLRSEALDSYLARKQGEWARVQAHLVLLTWRCQAARQVGGRHECLLQFALHSLGRPCQLEGRRGLQAKATTQDFARCSLPTPGGNGAHLAPLVRSAGSGSLPARILACRAAG